MIIDIMNQELELVTVGMKFLCSVVYVSSAWKTCMTRDIFNVWESESSEGFFPHKFNV